MGAESIIPIMMSQNRRIIEQIKKKKIKEAQKMKQVIYGKDWNQTYVADQGEYKGVKYFIVAGGIHPCAYVMCDESFVKKYKNEWGDFDCIRVHGGVTWCEDVSHLKTHPEEYEGMCFGWDYGHLNDWAGYWSDMDNMMSYNKKWTTDEILYECKYAIDQYLEAMEKERV